MKCKVAINACGLHVGGGVQVATSFIDELSRLKIEDLEIHIFASSEVTENLKSVNSSVINSPRYRIENTYGVLAFFSAANHTLSRFSLVFTIFGPNYLRVQSGVQIVGFAQPWIIDRSAYEIFGIKQRTWFKLKFLLQALFFKRADKLVVELDHVKTGLIKLGLAKGGDIEVVHNCVSSVYSSPSTWEPLSAIIKKPNYTVGYIGRDYPHKNTRLLPFVKAILREKHGLKVDFCVTLNDREWAAKSSDFRRAIANVGSLSVAQCPSFYEAVDAVIFPSLLECFSATPLEAMAMKKPLFASDRGFVRDVCGNFAFYFDPLAPESAADLIAEYINTRQGRDDERLVAAREHALNFSSARKRAERYVEIVREALMEKNSGKH